MSVDSENRALFLGASPWKLACRAVATTNITLSGEQTVDGVACVVGNRVLVAGQTDATENGPYIVFSTGWQRADDAMVANHIQFGMTMRVLEGTTNANTMWSMTSPTTGDITLGETELVFEAQ